MKNTYTYAIHKTVESIFKQNPRDFIAALLIP